MESDFSAVHRIDDIYAMSGPRFFKFANNMVHYQSAIRFNAERQFMEARGNGQSQRLSVVGDEADVTAKTKSELVLHKNFKAYPEAGFPSVFE